MSGVLIWSVIFIVSIAFLVKSSDLFIISAERIGRTLGIPSFIIGVTIVAAGTSLPELISSIFAVTSGSPEIVVGNVVGSNITNICLILGLLAVIMRKVSVDFEIIQVDLPLLIGSALLMGVMLADGNFSWLDAGISLTGLVVYIIYALKTDHGLPLEMLEGFAKANWRTYGLLVISGAILFVSAKYTVESVIHISDLLGIGAEVMALTAVALGTSLPELVVCIQATRKGRTDMAIGNIIGSNIFNSFAVMGIPRLFGELVIPQSIVYFSLPLMVVVTLLYFFVVQDKQITKWEGYFLLLFYIFFVAEIFQRQVAI